MSNLIPKLLAGFFIAWYASQIIQITLWPYREPYDYVFAPTIDKLDRWLDKLELKELDFSYKRDHCIIDTNGLESCGCLQYQKRTFTDDAKKYHEKGLLLPQMSLDSILGLYKDCRTQKMLAKVSILNETNGWRRWQTSVKKIGLPPVDEKDETYQLPQSEINNNFSL